MRKRICCVEANYEYEYGDEEPTIRHMLEMITQWGHWPHVHLQCGTVGLAKAFLEDRWRESEYGSVLLFAGHGSPGCFTLSNSTEESICLPELAAACVSSGGCEQCYVHFSACDVLKDRDAVEDFLRVTGATAVSGYRRAVGWVDKERPALLADIMLLNALWEREVDFSDARSFRPKLGVIEEDLQTRFGDCGFEMILGG